MAHLPSPSDVNIQLSLLRATGKDPLDSDLYLANSRDVLAQQLAATGQLATAVVNGNQEKEGEGGATQAFSPQSHIFTDTAPATGTGIAGHWQPNLAATGDGSAPIFTPSSQSQDAQSTSLSNGSNSNTTTGSSSSASNTSQISQTSSNTGSNGTNGSNGSDSQSTTTQTSTAINGADGQNGTNGKDGVNGTNGQNGDNGGGHDHGHQGGGDTTIIQQYYYSNTENNTTTTTNNTTNNYTDSHTNSVVNNTTIITNNNGQTGNPTHHDDHSTQILSNILNNVTLLPGNDLHLGSDLLSPVTNLVGDTVTQVLDITQPVTSTITTLLQPVGEHVGNVLGEVLQQVGTSTTTITTNLLGDVTHTVTQLTDTLTPTVNDLLHTVLNTVDQTLGSVTGTLDSTVNNVLNNVTTVTDHLTDTVTNTLDHLLNGGDTGDLPLDPLLHQVTDTVATITDGLGEVLQGGGTLLEPVTDAVHGITDGLNDVLHQTGGLSDLIDGLIPGEGALAVLDIGGNGHSSGSLLDLSAIAHGDASGTAPLIDITGLSSTSGAGGQLINLDLLNNQPGDHSGTLLNAGILNAGADHTADISLGLPNPDGGSTPLLDVNLLGAGDHQGELISIGLLDAPSITIPTDILGLNGLTEATGNLQGFLGDTQHGLQDAAAGLFASGTAIDLGANNALTGDHLALDAITQDIHSTTQAVLSGADALGDALLGQGVTGGLTGTLGNLLTGGAHDAAPTPTAPANDPGAALGHALGGLIPHWL